ncbi:hypothetical protein GH714_036145 [Hevea brasiliensis]|uniref:Uncharacterized protein n=1 Tax=Hevea brasiliensis TaxID=3981 RepID=A0A6A6L3W9_HEVBR|nr:hypothetical protein GH714_036145 [Hevea brasiliensis]
MAATISTVGAVNRAPLALNGSGAGSSVPTSAFLGSSLKKVSSRLTNSKFHQEASRLLQSTMSRSRLTRTDGEALSLTHLMTRYHQREGFGGLSLPSPHGNRNPPRRLSSYEYISAGLRQYNLDNNMDGFYIAPAFMDKLVVHITKNYMTLNIKVPLILGIWGGKGQENPSSVSLSLPRWESKLESGNAGEPAKLIRQRYREAADIIKKKGKMCCLFINDLDAGAGRLGGTTQYTVNNQMVNATL